MSLQTIWWVHVSTCRNLTRIVGTTLRTDWEHVPRFGDAFCNVGSSPVGSATSGWPLRLLRLAHGSMPARATFSFPCPASLLCDYGGCGSDCLLASDEFNYFIFFFNLLSYGKFPLGSGSYWNTFIPLFHYSQSCLWVLGFGFNVALHD